MTRLNRPGQEKRLAHLRARFRRAEPRKARFKAWKSLRRFSRTAGLITLGAAIGGGTFLALDNDRPPDAERQLSSRETYYDTCRDAFQDGHANIRSGEPGYRPELDADGDGLACEPYAPRY